MSIIDIEFISLIQKIKYFGNEVNTRNSTVKRLNTLSCSFKKTPLVSVRKTAWKNALREMEWFLSGSNNINDLHPKVRHWWEPWVNDKDVIPYNYSKQFRDFSSEDHDVDQIAYIINTLKKHPFSRRMVMTTWNAADMTHPNCPITNCHGSLIQIFAEPDNTVHMTMYQRSADMMLGVVHNWIQYWALLMYLAKRSNKRVGSFTWIGGDCHIYKAHYDMAETLISLNSNKVNTPPPNLVYNPTSENFKADDFTLDIEYKPIIKETLKMIV